MEHKIDEVIVYRGRLSGNDIFIMRMFGLTKDRLETNICRVRCRFEVKSGNVVYITGASGAGKSVLMRALEKTIPSSDRVNLNDIELAEDKSVIDCICEHANCGIIEGLKILSIAGLADVFCVLNQPINLSEGQKYRFRLAMAIGTKTKYVFADEFCNGLDRITGAVISYNIRRYSEKTGIIFVLASSHEDILMDLEPDIIIQRELAGNTNVIKKEV